MKKKLLTAVVLTLCAVALVAGSVFATIAYLTASSGVSNVFTVGKVSIDMKESKVNSAGQMVDANGNVIAKLNDAGVLVDPEGNTFTDAAFEALKNKIVKIDANSYHLLPGKKYIKDPTIYINSDDEMYLFVKSANLIRRAEEGNYEGGTAASMRKQMEANGWVEYVRSGDGTEIVWVYGTRNKDTGVIAPTPVSKTAKSEIKLCESFTVHPNVDVTVYGAAHVTFTAFAIQTTGFTNAENDDKHIVTNAAWTAVKTSFPYQCGIVNPVNPYDTSLEGNAAYNKAPGYEVSFARLPAPSVQNPENANP